MQLAPRLAVVTLTAIVLLAPAPRPAPAQQSAALLVQFRGQVKVFRGEAGEELETRVGLRLREDDRVDVPRGGRAVLLLKDGRLLTASSPVAVTAGGVTEASELFGETVEAMDRVADADAPPEEGEGGARPAPGAAWPLAPAGGVTVLEPRPRFTWQPARGAEGYTIQIRPLDGGGPVLRFETGADTVWSLPDNALPLRPGAEYAWTVVAGSAGRSAAQQRFRVADARVVERLGDFYSRLEEQGVDPRGDGLFLTAIVMNELGLAYEARRALEALEASGASLGPEVHLLRAQVYRKVGDLDAAREAYQEAGTGR